MWRFSSPELLATSLLLLITGPSVIPSVSFVSAEAVWKKSWTTSSSLMVDTVGGKGRRPWRERNVKNRRKNYFLSNLELSGDPRRYFREITGYECFLLHFLSGSGHDMIERGVETTSGDQTASLLQNGIPKHGTDHGLRRIGSQQHIKGSVSVLKYKHKHKVLFWKDWQLFSIF